MSATIALTFRSDPLRVSVNRTSDVVTQVTLDTGRELIPLTGAEAKELASALQTAAAFGPARELRRPAHVDDSLRALDR